MKQILIDTNVLVSFITERDLDQLRISRQLLEGAAGGELEVLLHDLVASELVFVLLNLYSVDAVECSQILEEFITLPGVVRVHGVPWSDVTKLWPSQVRDFADAVLAAVARDLRPSAVATFDQRFQRELRRLALATSW